MSAATTGGIVLAILGGLVAIGLAIFVTGGAGYLWALILVAWGLERIRDTNQEYPLKPLMLGLVIGLLYAFIGLVVYFVKDGNYLWAMILVNWLADTIV